KAKEGDSEAMEELVKNNEMLIWDVVKRFRNRGVELEDLFQLGAMGFVKAVKRFDLSRGLQLSTYAVPMIMGEIRRFLRDDGPVKVSRNIREIAIKARHTSDSIALREGREATLSEISKEMGIEESEIAAALVATERPDSVNRSAYNNEESDTDLQDVLEDGARFDEEVVTRLALSEAASRLDKRYRQILVLRYFKNMTQSSVAQMLGISQVQVSRLEKKMLSQMKEYMG
ncbi:MAG: SigB/SigF/SigG family RNA polymerase sigma factor, partial [Bacillota bacterium]|nr:SigB/SigF/SigG family RNA polymerase sigma factor [Bacillota bacterium]